VSQALTTAPTVLRPRRTTATYTITPAPTVNAGADRSLCGNNATATLGGSYTVATGATWSGGNGTFSPSANNVNATYTPTATEVSSGSVTLTLTTTGNNNCNAVADTKVINITPAPTVNAGANASVLPIMGVASLVGFGAVVAALPAFTMIRDAVLSIQGGPLISLTAAMNVLAGMTGSASGGMAIALDALGDIYLRLATEQGIDPELLHRIAVLSSGTLDALPHNGTVLTVLQVSGLTHRESYFDMVMTVIVGVIIAFVAVIVLGSIFGSF